MFFLVELQKLACHCAVFLARPEQVEGKKLDHLYNNQGGVYHISLKGMSFSNLILLLVICLLSDQLDTCLTLLENEKYNHNYVFTFLNFVQKPITTTYGLFAQPPPTELCWGTALKFPCSPS